MSERISMVVPNGTREQLQKEAKNQNRTYSNLLRKFISEGLKKCTTQK